jgi:hypothetical protein
MKRLLEVCLAALVTTASAAEGMSFAGIWEGRMQQGVKAVTLEVQASGGSFAGTAIFYVIKDEGEGKHVGGETRVAMEHVRSHDAVLEFDVTVSGGNFIHFRMTLNRGKSAELTRAPSGDQPELSIGLQRQVQL